MFKSYIKTSLRIFSRHPLNSFIHILGLALAIGCCLLVYTFVDQELSMDQYHPKSDKIFMSTVVINQGDNNSKYGISPMAYGERLKSDFPQISNVARFENRSCVAKSQGQVFNERISFTDPEFLDIFSFALKWGDKSALNDHSKVIISEPVSLKYFGDQNPLGERISFDFGNGQKASFEVGAVAKRFKAKSNLRFGILSNFNSLAAAEPGFNPADWSGFINATFIELNDPADIATITKQARQYIPVQNAARKELPITSFEFEPWSSVYLNGQNIRNSIIGESDPLATKILVSLAAFILLLASFNYINISIASGAKRLREIAVRKVMGGQRKSLTFQFLVENLVLTFFAGLIGFLMAAVVFIPGFNTIFFGGLELPYQEPQLWFFLVLTVLIIGLSSGAYPALYLSKFSALKIFKGKLRFGTKNVLARVFLTVQFVLSCITVVAGLVFTQNANYQEKRDWGYDKENVLVATLPDSSSLQQLKAEIRMNPDVLALSASAHHIGRSWGSVNIEQSGEQYRARVLAVDADYLPTLGIRLKAGSSFAGGQSAKSGNVIVNETMAGLLEESSAIGAQFRIDSLVYTVIGVAEDFHHRSFAEKIEPAFFRLAEDNLRFLSLKVREGRVESTFESLQNKWSELMPDTPFNGSIQGQRFDFFLKEANGHGKLLSTIAIMAVVLACLGLFGILSLHTTNRIKEFSIRKVLGAHRSHLFRLIHKQFTPFILIALIIGGVISYNLMSSLIGQLYVYHMPITWLPVLTTIFIVLLMVWLTTFTQIRKLIRANPTQGLRND
ncbi:MAG: FtsX-like permease family protein [Roseivirga sp.]|nr:FtsX-like permease family protein [Roseivirga sp.]